jgi:hypothetical protein
LKLYSTRAERSVSWEKQYWLVQPMWRGETVFILGGGPSLRGFDAEILRGEKVMVLNSSYLLAPWADVLFFVDTLWSEDHLDVVKNWKGMAVTTALGAKRILPSKIRRVQIHQDRDFLLNPNWVRVGRSSGHTGISLAISMGATTVVLLGYDMKFIDGRSHHHDHYFNRDPKTFSTNFLPAFEGWNEDARKVGVRVLNASPDSALEEFKKVDFEEFMTEYRCGPSSWIAPDPIPEPECASNILADG